MKYGIVSDQITGILNDDKTQQSVELKKEQRLLKNLGQQFYIPPEDIVLIYRQDRDFYTDADCEGKTLTTKIQWASLTSHGKKDKSQNPKGYAKLEQEFGNLYSGLSDHQISTFQTWLRTPIGYRPSHRFTKIDLGKTQGSTIKYGIELWLDKI